MLARLVRSAVAAAALAVAAVPSIAAAQSPFKASVTVGNAFYLVTVGSTNGFVAPGSIDPNGPRFSFLVDKFFCTDDNNTVQLGSTFDAWVTPIWTLNQNMSYTRLGARGVTNAQSLYQANAFSANTITGNDGPSQAAQASMWNVINNPTAPGNNALPRIANPLGWFVISQTDAFNRNDAKFGGNQELLAYSSTTVPEPSTYALLVPALLVVVGVARRRGRVATA